MSTLFYHICVLFCCVVYVRCAHRKPPVAKKPYNHHESDLCPVVVCENDGVIPDECRKPQFVIGYDGETLCKICDASFCGRHFEVCERKLCSNQHLIEPLCRKPNYYIGTDGITRCHDCDTNACGDPSTVCPQIDCPNADRIKNKCRIKQYVIGRDGITKCRVCDKDACRGSNTGIHNILVDHHHH